MDLGESIVIYRESPDVGRAAGDVQPAEVWNILAEMAGQAGLDHDWFQQGW